MPSLVVIPGDGIGPEVTEQALRVLRCLAERSTFELDTTILDIGAERYLSTGQLLTEDDVATLREHDAFILGALGDPRVAPGLLERDVIVAVRRSLDLAVNVRPIRLLPGAKSALRTGVAEACDFVVVRENTEGLYAGGSSIAREGSREAVAVQTSITTAAATKAVMEYAFHLAASRHGHVTVCHKTNILVDAGRIWTAVMGEMSDRFPAISVDYAHADAMALYLVTRPESFDVIVTDNLFGDILSDLGAGLVGGLGTAASANLNLDGGPSMFEPVHGSAPDIAGKGVANPAAAILSAAMLLEHLGLPDEAAVCFRAVDSASADWSSSGQEMNTEGFGDLVLECIAKSSL